MIATCHHRRRIWSRVVLLVVWGCFASEGQGAVFHTRVVRVNDEPIQRTAHVVVHPGDQVDVEFYVSAWGQELDNVKTWQVSVDGEGFTSGDQGLVRPLGWEAPFFDRSCESDTECGGGVCNWFQRCRYQVCTQDVDCEVPFECIELREGRRCLGANHDPEAGGFIDDHHPEYIFREFDNVIAAVSYFAYDFKYGATLFLDDGPADEGGMRYLSTLRLVVSLDARGLFTIGPEEHPHTFLTDPDRVDAGTELDPATIEVVVDLTQSVAACCTARRGCEDLTRTDCALARGLWQEGQVCGVGKQSCLAARRLRKYAQD